MPYLRCGTLSSQPLNLSIAINLVVLKHRQLDFLPFVLDLLGRSVDFLLALLGTTAKAEDEMESRFLLDVVVRKSPAVFELLASEDQTLLVGRDAFLVYDESEYIS